MAEGAPLYEWKGYRYGNLASLLASDQASDDVVAMAQSGQLLVLL